VGALYVQNFLIFRKLKTNYRNFKKIFHITLQLYMFSENEIFRFWKNSLFPVDVVKGLEYFT